MNLLEVDISDLCEILGTDLQKGLTSEGAEKNRKEFGANRLFESAIRSPGDFATGIFGDIMALLFITLSFFALFLQKDFTALVCL
jgi:magnesium-transporting ATPase (P-type)